MSEPSAPSELSPDDVADVASVTVPEELPVMPLRGTVLFPYLVIPVQAGRARSLQLVDDVAVREQKLFAVVAQKDPEEEDPGPEGIYGHGAACRILRLMKLPDGNVRMLVQGLRRIRFDEFTTRDPYLVARVTVEEDRGGDGVRAQALRKSVLELFRSLLSMTTAVPEELLASLESAGDGGRVADFVTANLSIPTEEKQRVLEALDVARRLEVVTELLTRELEVAEIQKEIQEKVREEMGKKSREAVLREQLRAIQSELGEKETGKQEIEDLRSRIEDAKMPEEAEKAALAELDRLSRMHPSAVEYSFTRTYLDWMVSVPWSKESEDRLDVKEAQKILDEDHFDIEKVKERILEYLSVLSLKKDKKGPILCLVGPPGVGKTSLGRSIARATGREFVRMSLGGVRDEAEIRGHRRTYVGSLPGRVIQSLKKAGTRNPVFMLDEVDKIGADFRGDPASALLEVLDPEQNDSFADHYLEVPFDLSRVLFIATANVLDTIPGPLRDRMEIIALPGYAEEDKVGIATRHLTGKQLAAHGISAAELTIEEGALRRIVSSYTREAGVRNLEREIGRVCRKIARRIVEGEKPPFRVGEEDLKDLLGPPRFFSEVAERTSVPGVVTGLVWTPVGGEIVFIEATRMRGKKAFTLTGLLGDVMKESAQAALSWVRANAESLSIDPEEFERYEVHLHVPAGATPKDGPSAGVAMACAIASLFSGRIVKSDLAMTGEITLRGRVLPVGGVKEKVLGALRAGIRTVVLPERNAQDVEEIPEKARSRLTFFYAKTMADVLRHALSEEETAKDGAAQARASEMR